MIFERTLGNRRKWLRDSVERILIPELAKMGFHRLKLKYNDDTDRELMSTLPFGVHYAKVKEVKIQLEIDMLRSSGPPEICIIFGLAPHGSAEYIPISWQVSDIYTLCQSARCQKPFRLSWWNERKAKAEHYDNLVLMVVQKLPQIYNFLNKGIKGPNIRRWQGSGEFTGYKDKQ